MKRSLVILAAALLAPLSLSFGQGKPPPVSAYEQAVRAYVEAAQAEVAALEAQFLAATEGQPEEVVERFQRVAERLKQAQAALDQLKKARQSDFDEKKLAYENARGSYARAFEQANRQSPAAQKSTAE